MTIQSIRTQQLEKWYEISGTIKEVKELKQRGKDQRLMHKFVLEDATGEITVWSDTINNQPYRQGGQFSGRGLLTKYNEYIYMDWAKPQQTAPPQHREAPQQGLQSPKAPQGIGNGRNISIERQAAFKAACHAFCHQPEKTDNEIISLAIKGAYFIETGKQRPIDIDDFTEPPPQDESDIPPFP